MNDIEETFLRAARMGSDNVIRNLLETCSTLNVDCVGRNKRNRGWSPIHLSAYFGHRTIVEILLQNGCDPDAKNVAGDTALHKCALTGREDIVDLLIGGGADVRLINADGFRPVEITAVQSIKEKLEAAELVVTRKGELDLLEAASANDTSLVNSILRSRCSPNIDCTDANGNSPLHNAAYRGHKETVLVLLQNGADTTLKNRAGHTASDLAQSADIKRVLSSIRDKICKRVYRFEGLLLLKKRVLRGFKPVVAVLDHGSLSWYLQKNDGKHLEGFKFLLQTEISKKDDDLFSVRGPDEKETIFKVPSTHKEDIQIYRQRWINALVEHREYANRSAFALESDETVEPLSRRKSSETLGTALKETEAQFQVFSKCVSEADILVKKLPVSYKHLLHGEADTLLQCSGKFGEALHVLTELRSSLNDCMNLMNVQEAIERANLVPNDDVLGAQPDRIDSDSDEFFDAEGESHVRPNMTHQLEPRRNALPVQRPSTQYSIWSVLKHCIGKDLSRITLPVTVNEPLTFLQRICETLEYDRLLQQALSCADALERTKYVAAFFYSHLASSSERSCKPFNPLLGETFELYRDDRGYRVVAEQVSHHPPITAFYCEGDGFTFWGSMQAQLKLTGRGLEVTPNGSFTLELHKYNEVYTWTAPAVRVHNVVVGKLWVERYGLVTVKNHSSGHMAHMDFKALGWLGGDPHNVEGYIESPRNEVKCVLRGKWTKELRCYPVEKGADEISALDLSGDFDDTKEATGGFSVLWKAFPKPPEAEQMYGLTAFAISLNELSPSIAEKIAPTDSRLRPDVRLMENGDIEGAANEKHRLEEKQRAARRKRNENKEEWTPKWFKQGVNEHTHATDWIFTGEFWSRDFSRSPDIF
ncbi:oxysterol-binding protein-related protein 1-like [Oscarella lobularis]|uniref:oxysterol-binding protein-related protein 1-like n=1 Tax=Oscarella lobularis TaxID=121494 RepID=UPI0033143764